MSSAGSKIPPNAFLSLLKSLGFLLHDKSFASANYPPYSNYRIYVPCTPCNGITRTKISICKEV